MWCDKSGTLWEVPFPLVALSGAVTMLCGSSDCGGSSEVGKMCLLIRRCAEIALRKFASSQLYVEQRERVVSEWTVVKPRLCEG